jgi:hypothetical protein
MKTFPSVAAALAVLILLGPTSAPCAFAQQTSSLKPVSDYFSNWFERVKRIKDEQPEWITPVATVTPLLEEEFRYDEFWHSGPHGLGMNISGGKGIELIPYDRIEVILGIPAYITRTHPRGTNGWGDTHFLVKYRMLTAPAEQGDYVLTLFVGFSAPTGSKPNGAGYAIYTPAIAFGKGWGNFDFQSTVGASFPAGGMGRIGIPIDWNTAFQYRVLRKIWPQIEVNYTWWASGEKTGKNQVFLTPGVVLGSFPLWRRLRLTAGLGYQVAVTSQPAYNHGWILTVRTPF